MNDEWWNGRWLDALCLAVAWSGIVVGAAVLVVSVLWSVGV